jgi:hypothetical protein
MWLIFTQAATLLILIMTDYILLQQCQYEGGGLGHFRFGSVLRSKPVFRRGVLTITGNGLASSQFNEIDLGCGGKRTVHRDRGMDQSGLAFSAFLVARVR